MKTKKTCKDCIWCDSCENDCICNDFTDSDDEYAGEEYNADLHIRETESQHYIDEMAGDA